MILLMPRKSNNNISKNTENKAKETFLSGISEKKLVTEIKNDILYDIAKEFDDQFHYSLTINGSKLS